MYTRTIEKKIISSVHQSLEGWKSLPVIDTLLQTFTPEFQTKPLEKTAIVYIHHPLKTSVNLVEAMLKLGAHPKNLFVLGKKYSECKQVVHAIQSFGVNYRMNSGQSGFGQYSSSFSRDIHWLWHDVLQSTDGDIEEVLILDHGGHASSLIPPEILDRYKVIGIEKTTAGLIHFQQYGFPSFPIISLASCAAKTVLESPLIAHAIIHKLTTFLQKKLCHAVPGVVGYGAVGQALTNKLISMGHTVRVYDEDESKLLSTPSHKNIIYTHDLAALIDASDYIFGCTGRDITKSHGDCFRWSPKNKYLVSCSSEDKEFLSLLRSIQPSVNLNQSKILEDIEYKTEMGSTIHILSGGFPINFDHSGVSVPAADIQLTRSLTLGAVFQAIDLFKKEFTPYKEQIYTLDHYLQKFIVDNWLPYKTGESYKSELLEQFNEKLSEDQLRNDLMNYVSPFNKASQSLST